MTLKNQFETANEVSHVSDVTIGALTGAALFGIVSWFMSCPLAMSIGFGALSGAIMGFGLSLYDDHTPVHKDMPMLPG